MEKTVQIFTVSKKEIDLKKGTNVVFTFHIPEILLKKMFSDLGMKYCSSWIFALSYSDLCKINSWMRKLEQETVYKFYEQKDWTTDPESAHEEMLKYFVSYTGLTREECTDEFRCDLMEFLNTDSGKVFFLMDDLYRIGEENAEYCVFMRVLQT